jgi:hypothetical protein
MAEPVCGKSRLISAQAAGPIRMRWHATWMPPPQDTRRWACQRVLSGQVDALLPVPLAGRDR